jgi:filamentous hemagglutinin
MGKRQAESEESQRSTDSLDALQSESGRSAATTSISTDADEEPLYKAADIHAQLPKASDHKTVATVGKFQTLSEWSPKRSEAFTSVDPLDILRYSEKIGHPIKRNGKLDHGVPGQFYASHAERQAALLNSGLIEIHPHPMCPDCVAWFQRHAAFTKKQWVVRDPKNINVFYPDGSLKQIPVK